MAEFKGYLISVNGTELPNKFIVEGSYETTDNQRTELKAYRDNSNKLHRQTSPNYKTSMEFTTPCLFLSELKQLKKILDSGIINATERKIKIKYWNSEDLCYRTMEAYMPDKQHPIKAILNGEPLYEGITYQFIQY